MTYPIVTSKGETILDDVWLIRHIREKCGDEIADALEETLDMRGGSQKEKKATMEDIATIRSDLSDIDEALEALWEKLNSQLK